MAWNDAPPETTAASWSDAPPDTKKRNSDFPGRGLLKAATESLPTVGSMIGGGLGFASPMPGGLLVGSGLGAAGGKALENIIEQHVLGEDKDLGQLYAEPAKEFTQDMALGMAPMGLGKVLNTAKSHLYTPMKKMAARYGAEAIPNADEVIAAASRMNVDPTRGMLTNERAVQKLESGLAQSPTSIGQDMAEKMTKINEGMKAYGEGALGHGQSMTKIQSAAAGKGAISESLTKKIQPAVDTYKQIESEIIHIPVGQKSSGLVARNIKELPYAKIKGSQEANFANQIAENVSSLKSLDELRNLRSYVGKTFNDKNVSPQMRQTAGEIYSRLTRMEQRSITKAAIEAGQNPKHGEAVAREMIGQIKEANKIYSSASKDVQDLAESVGLGKVQNYADFIRKIEKMPDEKFVDKFFNPNNVKALDSFKSKFPEAFESLRSAKVGQVYKDSVVKGELSVASLVNNVKKMTPESRRLIFGDESDKMLKDIELVYNRTYHKVGPSGTPEGLYEMGQGVFKPSTWFQTLHDQAKDWMLKNPEKLRSISKSVREEEMLGPPAGLLSPLISQRKKSYSPAVGISQQVGRGLLRSFGG